MSKRPTGGKSGPDSAPDVASKKAAPNERPLRPLALTAVAAAFLAACVVGVLICASGEFRTGVDAQPSQANASNASGSRNSRRTTFVADPSSQASKSSEPPASAPVERINEAGEARAKRVSDSVHESNWLKCNSDGEPYEATLADGTVLKVETYGDEYEAYDSLPSIDVAHEAETVVDYEKLKRFNVTFYSIRLDLLRGAMYWIEMGGATWQKLSSARLDGTELKTVLDIPFQNPVGLAFDAANRKIYWTSNAPFPAFGKPAVAKNAVWRANFDGSAPEAVFGGLESARAVALAPSAAAILYFDDLRLVRGFPDGSGEQVLFDQAPQGLCYPGSWAAVDPLRGVLYWAGDGTYIAAIKLDGSRFQVVVDLGLGFGHISGVALDDRSKKLYWTERAYQEIWRANLDGSQPELIAVGLGFPRGIDVDPEHGTAYWTDWRHGTVGLIRRIKLPPLLTPHVQTAPPLISVITPSSQRPGLKITLRGKHFARTSRVQFIDDNGNCRDAAFTAKSDTELIVTTPEPVGTAKRAAILIHTPGGVTATLPRDATVEHSQTAFDRFRDPDKSPFVIAEGACLDRIERSVAYCPAGSRVSAGDRGGAVFFLKNGASTVIREAPDVVVYHEPFARIQRRAKAAPDATFVSVPAIRPSFVSESFQYQTDD